MKAMRVFHLKWNILRIFFAWVVESVGAGLVSCRLHVGVGVHWYVRIESVGPYQIFLVLAEGGSHGTCVICGTDADGTLVSTYLCVLHYFRGFGVFDFGLFSAPYPEGFSRARALI